jgi:outer membrane protein assembly factor BamB
MSLYALDEQSGNIVWGPIALNGTGMLTAFSAYDNGKVFVVTNDGHLQSFNATTGQMIWTTQLTGQHSFTSPPTAVNGLIYIGGAGSGGTLYGVDENNGGILWTSSVENGDMSSPTVTADGVFVSYPCQVYKFNPTTGAQQWHYSGSCSGGGGETSTYLNNQLFVRDVASGSTVNIFGATSGAISGSLAFNSANPIPIPALSNQTGYFLDGTTLKAIDLTSHNVNWTFTGDGNLVTAPIIVDQTVFIGASSGNVYAVDAASGALLWTGNAGASISSTNDMSPFPLTALGAGEGYLVVPAGNVLTAWRIISP